MYSHSSNIRYIYLYIYSYNSECRALKKLTKQIELPVQQINYNIGQDNI